MLQHKYNAHATGNGGNLDVSNQEGMKAVGHRYLTSAFYLAKAALLGFALIPLSALAFFGTVVTPIEYEVRLLAHGQALSGYGLAMHRADPGAEPYLPWKDRFITDENGGCPRLSYSWMKGASVLTRRIRTGRLLIALRRSDRTKSEAVPSAAEQAHGLTVSPKQITQIDFRALNLTVRRGGKVSVVVEEPNGGVEDVAFQLVTGAQRHIVSWPQVKASAEALDIEGKPGWRIHIDIDLGDLVDHYR
jgi:hypothetical protein